MLVANSFDLWQKDTFFSAAEEVQQSADIMESSFRTWERQKREGLTSQDLDEFCRELQTALGTAKWQLEEFEKAVRQSYRSRADEYAMARHRQFVDVIENQIARVETALQESFSEKGNPKPLRWVNLNEDECNDLAAFLSGPPATSQNLMHHGSPTSRNSSSNSSRQKSSPVKHKQGHRSTEASSFKIDIPYCTNGLEDALRFNRDDKDGCCEADAGAWKIVIDEEHGQNRALMEATPKKDKGSSKSVFSRQKCGDRSEAKGGVLSYSHFRGIRWINQVLRHVSGCQRQIQSHPYVRLTSFRLKIALLLTFFLIVPFLLYST